MTDDLLVELIGERPIEDFTGAELAEIRMRLTESPVVREALRGRLQLEQALHQTVGQAHLPIGLLLAKAAAMQATSTVAKLFGWGSATGLMIGLVSVGIVARHGNHRPAAPPKAIARQIFEPSSPSDASPADRSDVLLLNPDPARTPSKENTAKLGLLTRGMLPANDADEVVFANHARAAAWRESLETIAGDITQRSVDDRPVLVLRGAHVLTANWPQDGRIRVKLADHNRFKIHLSHSTNDPAKRLPVGNWPSGPSSLTLEFFAQPRPLWVAWLAARRGNQALPETLGLAAHDAGRLADLDADTIDIAYHQGRVMLTHGETQLLTAPLSGMPDRIAFEGDAVVHGLDFADGMVALAEPAPSPDRSQAEAADREWKPELAAGATWSVLPAGRLELLAEDTRAESRAAFSPGPARELVFELEDPLPGTGIYVCDPGGEVITRLAFIAGEKPSQVCFALTGRDAANAALPDGPAPLCPARVWFKLVADEQRLRAWFSCDGAYWSMVLGDNVLLSARVSTAGIYCLGGPGTRSIRVARLAMRGAVQRPEPARDLFGEVSHTSSLAWRVLD